MFFRLDSNTKLVIQHESRKKEKKVTLAKFSHFFRQIFGNQKFSVLENFTAWSIKSLGDYLFLMEGHWTNGKLVNVCQIL